MPGLSAGLLSPHSRDVVCGAPGKPSARLSSASDPTKAREKLGWTPTTTLEQLVAEMVETDLEEARKEALLKREGFNVVGARE